MFENIIKRILDSDKEERQLEYTLQGTPVIWDLPKFTGEILRVINLLDDPLVIKALRQGLKLPEAQHFLWITSDGELDYGVVQGGFFITLWIPGASELKTVSEARERVLSLAREKLARERRWNGELIKDLRNPWFAVTRAERRSLLQGMLENLHPLWDDFRREVEFLLAVY